MGEGGEGEQVLKDHLFNEDKENAWRLDVDADCFKEVGSAVSAEAAEEDAEGRGSDSDDEDSSESESGSEEDDDDEDEEESDDEGEH